MCMPVLWLLANSTNAIFQLHKWARNMQPTLLSASVDTSGTKEDSFICLF
jgi:hypothetical protein